MIILCSSLNSHLDSRDILEEGIFLKIETRLYPGFCCLFFFLFNFGAIPFKRFRCFSSSLPSFDRFKKYLPIPVRNLCKMHHIFCFFFFFQFISFWSYSKSAAFCEFTCFLSLALFLLYENMTLLLIPTVTFLTLSTNHWGLLQPLRCFFGLLISCFENVLWVSFLFVIKFWNSNFHFCPRKLSSIKWTYRRF